MAPWGETYENPFTPVSARAAKIFGKWLRELSLGWQPGVAEQVMDRNAFVTEMDARLGLVGKDFERQRNAHYRIRADVTEIVFQHRDKSRVVFLLPEPDAVGRFNAGTEHVVDMPVCYLNAVGQLAPEQRAQYAGQASYPYRVDAQNYEAFLDPFMAAYTCSQCA